MTEIKLLQWSIAILDIKWKIDHYNIHYYNFDWLKIILYFISIFHGFERISKFALDIIMINK